MKKVKDEEAMGLFNDFMDESHPAMIVIFGDRYLPSIILPLINENKYNDEFFTWCELNNIEVVWWEVNLCRPC